MRTLRCTKMYVDQLTPGSPLAHHSVRPDSAVGARKEPCYGGGRCARKLTQAIYTRSSRLCKTISKFETMRSHWVYCSGRARRNVCYLFLQMAMSKSAASFNDVEYRPGLASLGNNNTRRRRVASNAARTNHSLVLCAAGYLNATWTRTVIGASSTWRGPLPDEEAHSVAEKLLRRVIG